MKTESKGAPTNQSRVMDPAAAKKKKQLVIIAILLVVLLLAITMSPSGGKPSATESSQPAVSVVSLKPTAKRLAVNGNDETMQRFHSREDLPALSADQIFTTNLFARPAIIPASPAIAPQSVPSSAPEPLKHLKVGAIYGSFDGPDRAALIDGRIMQTGEEVTPGIKILMVSPEGVHVTP
ncbi:MAG: hypothetical protein KDB00_26555 [Planctomycetales bacterium]|nr:hypothetical protein [Planctomycetales bacterium]